MTLELYISSEQKNKVQRDCVRCLLVSVTETDKIHIDTLVSLRVKNALTDTLYACTICGNSLQDL